MKIALSLDQLEEAIAHYARRKRLINNSDKAFEVDLPFKDSYGVAKKMAINIK